MNLREDVELTIEAILDKLQKSEDYYKSLELLIFKRNDGSKVIVKKTNTAKSFVTKFFEKFNNEFYTHYKNSDNSYSTIETRRSIGDVFRSAYSYLGSKITLVDVLVETYQLWENKEIGSNYCKQITKRVYIDRGDNNGCYYDSTLPDELGLTKAHYLLLKNHIQNN